MEKLICFEIDNFEKIDLKNPINLSNSEKDFARIGALPAKIDYPTKAYCLTITKTNITEKVLQKIFRKYGYKAKLK